MWSEPGFQPLPTTVLLVPLSNWTLYWPPAPSVMVTLPLSFQYEKK